MCEVCSRWCDTNSYTNWVDSYTGSMYVLCIPQKVSFHCTCMASEDGMLVTGQVMTRPYPLTLAYNVLPNSMVLYKTAGMLMCISIT